MDALWQIAAFKLYAIAGTFLALQTITLALWTGTVRTMRKQYVNPEDSAIAKGSKVSDADHPDTLRVRRAHQNLLENAVPFFVVGFLYAVTNPGVLGAQAYFGTFVATRVLHSVFYLWGRQPFRTISFGIGVLTIIGMAVHVLRFALAA